METPNTNTNLGNWRDEISDSKEQIKIKDGESKTVVFADEGKRSVHPDFGTSIVFSMLEDGSKESKRFYVKENNFSLLQQIKALGPVIAGMKVKISRTGSTKSNTRYRVEKA